jgi:hypothetical protein
MHAAYFATAHAMSAGLSANVPWTPSPGFDDRTARHLAASLGRVLGERHPFILTHATRGEIVGRTTRILRELERHRLRDVPLLEAQDAPHDVHGYAIEKSAAKQKHLALLLAPYKDDLHAALLEQRMLVTGKFAQSILRRLGLKASEDQCIGYPSCWRNLPIAETRQKLAAVLGPSTPTEEQLAGYIVVAHRQAMRARWKRLSSAERQAVRSLLCRAYAALPQEEKDRRAQLKADAWAALPQEEKDRRAQLKADTWAALPQEEKDRRAQTVADAYAALPQEEKDRRVTVSSAGMQKFWKAAPAVVKLARAQSLRASRGTVAGRTAWRVALCAARASMPKQTRLRVEAAMRRGYAAKMTTAQKTRMGLRRRQAWTEEKRQEAAARFRGSSTEAAAAANLEKAHAVLKDPVTGKAALNKRLTTKAIKVEQQVRELKRLMNAGAAVAVFADRTKRAALRNSCRGFLEWHAQGRLDVDEECVTLLKEGIEMVDAAGKGSKSEALKSRFAKRRGEEEDAAEGTDKSLTKQAVQVAILVRETKRQLEEGADDFVLFTKNKRAALHKSCQ